MCVRSFSIKAVCGRKEHVKNIIKITVISEFQLQEVNNEHFQRTTKYMR